MNDWVNSFPDRMPVEKEYRSLIATREAARRRLDEINTIRRSEIWDEWTTTYQDEIDHLVNEIEQTSMALDKIPRTQLRHGIKYFILSVVFIVLVTALLVYIWISPEKSQDYYLYNAPSILIIMYAFILWNQFPYICRWARKRTSNEFQPEGYPIAILGLFIAVAGVIGEVFQFVVMYVVD